MEKRIKLIISLAMCFIVSSYSVCVYAVSLTPNGAGFDVEIGKGHSTVTGEGNKEQTGNVTTGGNTVGGTTSMEGEMESYLENQNYNPFTSAGTDTGAVIVNKGTINKNELDSKYNVYQKPIKDKSPNYDDDNKIVESSDATMSEAAQSVLNNIVGDRYNNNGTLNPGLIFNKNPNGVNVGGKENLGIVDYPTFGDRYQAYNDYITYQCVTDTVEVYQIKEYKYVSVEQNKKLYNKFMENYALYVYKADSKTDYDCIDDPNNYITSAKHSGQMFSFTPATSGFYCLVGLQEYQKSSVQEYKYIVSEYYVLVETGDVIFKTTSNTKKIQRGKEIVNYWRYEEENPIVIVEIPANQMALMWITPNGVVLDLGTTERIE